MRIIAADAVKFFPRNVNSDLFPVSQEDNKDPATTGNCFPLCHCCSRI